MDKIEVKILLYVLITELTELARRNLLITEIPAGRNQLSDYPARYHPIGNHGIRHT